MGKAASIALYNAYNITQQYSTLSIGGGNRASLRCVMRYAYPKEMSGVDENEGLETYSHVEGAIENHDTQDCTYSRAILGVWHDESNDTLRANDAKLKSDEGRVCYSLNK